MHRKFLIILLLATLLAGCTRGESATAGHFPTGAIPPSIAAGTLPALPGTSPAPLAARVLPAVPAVPEPARLASYSPEPVSVMPAVEQAEVETDLSNVVNSFLLTDAQVQGLVQNGFVVGPSGEKDFYVLYEQVHSNYEPVFVTSDSLLHVYGLLSDKVLRNLEKEQLAELLKQLNARMLQSAAEQYQAVRGTSLEEAARRNVAYFAVAGRLLDPGVMIPDYVGDMARAELDQVEQHSGTRQSLVFPDQQEDYAQYVPRGHYTVAPELESYFKAMTWYGRMTFRIVNPDDPAGRDETTRALLVVQALAADPEAARLWSALYEPLAFFAGRGDGLLYSEYLPLMGRLYGGLPDPVDLADESKLTQFMQEAQKLRPPDVSGLGITSGQEQEGTPGGFRFIGQRIVPDSSLFARLVEGQVPGRRLPKGLDLLAALGSQRAYTILGQQGDASYQNYIQNMNDLRQKLAGLSQDGWTQSLYASWLYTFLPLLNRPGGGYPAFMQSDAWLEKSMNTSLGSWAELRQDAVLYAEQAGAEGGGGGKGPPPEPASPKGYVEPVPDFYARVAALAQMTLDGLQQRGLGGDKNSPLFLALQSLQQFKDLASALKTMAEKELANQPLSDDEYSRIVNYGREVEQLTFAATDGYQGSGGISGNEAPQAAAVAAVANTSDRTLVEGVGRISAIYAIVPIEGELVVAKGGVYSYYEFEWPADDRLADDRWQEMLDGGQAPGLPGWTSSFRVEETEDWALRDAVWQFNKQFTAAAWAPDPALLDPVATGEALTGNQDYIKTNLIDEGLYEGNWLIRLEFLSLEQQDLELAIVTAQETWIAEQYQVATDPAQPGALVSQRAEYTVKVVYRLVPVDGSWKVAQVMTLGVPTPWEKVEQ